MAHNKVAVCAASGLLAAAFSTAALAQSSVTLYGIIDYGLNFVSNAQTSAAGKSGRTGHRQWFMSSGALQGDRLGLRGSENLGGGYGALFVLENGFDVGTGRFQQGGDLFGRQAYIGLSSPYGKITIGRQYDEFVDYFGPLSSAAFNGVFADHASDVDNVGNDYRVNNAIKFTSLKSHGFMFSALFGFGNSAGNFARSSVKSFGASYSSGPLIAAVAYTNTNSPNQSFFGNNQTSSTTGNNLGAVNGVTTNPAIAGFASAGSLETYGAAATYVVGSVTAGIMYTRVNFKNLNSPASGDLVQTNPLRYAGSTGFNDYSVYGAWYVRPTLYLSIGYNYMNGGAIDGKASASFQTVNSTLTYFLSSRTSIYINGNYQRALGVDSTGQGAVATLVAATPSNSGKQLLVRMGMRNLF